MAGRVLACRMKIAHKGLPRALAPRGVRSAVRQGRPVLACRALRLPWSRDEKPATATREPGVSQTFMMGVTVIGTGLAVIMVSILGRVIGHEGENESARWFQLLCARG